MIEHPLLNIFREALYTDAGIVVWDHRLAAQLNRIVANNTKTITWNARLTAVNEQFMSTVDIKEDVQ